MKQADIFFKDDYFILPEREINEISRGLERSNTVCLQGNPGTGKTILAKYYQIINPLKYKEVNYFKAVEFDFDKSKFALLQVKPKEKNERLLIIDGFDEIFSNETKERISELISENFRNKHNGVKLLLTSRPTYGNFPGMYCYNVFMTGWNNKQVLDYLKMHFRQEYLEDEFIKHFGAIAEKINNKPLILNQVVELIKKENVTPQQILNLLNNNLHYKNSTIDSFEKTTLQLATTPKIISDISIINQSIIDKVKRNPELLYRLSSRQFEELIAELFDKEGYKVTLTQATRDGGKDLLLIEQRRIGNFLIYVECKNYSIENPVGVRLVRELYGTVMADKATAGVLVTSSYFSSPAVEFKEQVKSQLSLIDYYDLKKWIDEKANT